MLFIYVEMSHSIPWTCKINVSTMFVYYVVSPVSELRHNPTQFLLLLMSGESTFTVTLEWSFLLGTEESLAEETPTPDRESPWLHRGQVTIR